jgi:hypothetical protein
MVDFFAAQAHHRKVTATPISSRGAANYFSGANRPILGSTGLGGQLAAP